MIGYFGWFVMARLATSQTASASLIAHLGGSLNGLHKAFVSIDTLEVKLFSVLHPSIDASIRGVKTKKDPNLSIEVLFLLSFVGMTRFELATTRPPDVYSNRAELHPAVAIAKIILFFLFQKNPHYFYYF